MPSNPSPAKANPKPDWDEREFMASLEAWLSLEEHGFQQTRSEVIAFHRALGLHLWEQGIWLQSILFQSFHCDLLSVTYGQPPKPGVIKIMTRGQKGFSARFETEIRLLQHCAAIPGVIRIADHGRFRDFPYHLCEKVPGVPLEHATWPPHPDPLKKKLETILETTSVLMALYRAGVVHRDVAPDHIFISQSGVTLLDFGMASNLAQCDEPQRQKYLGNDLSNLGFTLAHLLLERVRFPFGNPKALAAAWLSQREKLSQRLAYQPLFELVEGLIRANREIPLPQGPVVTSMREAHARLKTEVDRL